DAYQYQRIFDALIKLEADYDRRLKESQTQVGITVKWDIALNTHLLVYFQLSRRDGPELKVVIGDELVLRYPGDATRGPWESRGQVTQITVNEEIVLELKSKKDAPTDQTFGFSVDFVWKPTSFERMHMALKRFVLDEYSLTGYLFHLILGHDVES
ncbi:hypothetical protein BVRB_038150, partial [Beta vulgaris subsp. vulgaris]